MSRKAKVYLTFLTILVFLSLSTNILIIVVAQRLQQGLAEGGKVAVQSLGMAARQLDDLATSTISMTVPISEELEIAVTVPFREELVVPIATVIPLNANLELAFSLGPAGAQSIEVPIQAEIPISLTVPVKIDRQIPVYAKVPISMEIPVSIPLAQTPLATQLSSWEEMLTQLNNQLSRFIAQDQRAPDIWPGFPSLFRALLPGNE
ncbi:MAG: hypothetical protein Q9O62_03845 [Ardenticatenia bacterium]|nr:hypothetical protein [Ardenticatenia bacterium]